MSSQLYAAPMILRVYDGDTVKIKDGAQTFKLRLSEIDAPEYNQSYGKKSRRALRKLCEGMGKTIEYRTVGLDKYGRSLGYLVCNQTDVNAYMLQNGHAWFNEKYSNNSQFRQMGMDARLSKLGLWKVDENPIPPWKWREIHPHTFGK